MELSCNISICSCAVYSIHHRTSFTVTLDHCCYFDIIKAMLRQWQCQVHKNSPRTNTNSFTSHSGSVTSSVVSHRNMLYNEWSTTHEEHLLLDSPCCPDLKRFSEARRTSKLSTFVNFPLKDLDLREFASENSSKSKSGFTLEVEFN